MDAKAHAWARVVSARTRLVQVEAEINRSVTLLVPVEGRLKIQHMAAVNLYNEALGTWRLLDQQDYEQHVNPPMADADVFDAMGLPEVPPFPMGVEIPCKVRKRCYSFGCWRTCGNASRCGDYRAQTAYARENKE